MLARHQADRLGRKLAAESTHVQDLTTLPPALVPGAKRTPDAIHSFVDLWKERAGKLRGHIAARRDQHTRRAEQDCAKAQLTARSRA